MVRLSRAKITTDDGHCDFLFRFAALYLGSFRTSTTGGPLYSRLGRRSRYGHSARGHPRYVDRSPRHAADGRLDAGNFHLTLSGSIGGGQPFAILGLARDFCDFDDCLAGKFAVSSAVFNRKRWPPKPGRPFRHVSF